MTQHNQLSSPPPFNFTFSESVAGWNVTAPNWLTTNNKTWDGLAAGAMVFDAQDRLLLVQRAAHDSMPNRWENPGGAVDREDPSVLYGCARELWEESGLVAKRINHIVTEGEGIPAGSVFTNRTGRRIFCKFSFEVEVEEGEVRLDPQEHQDYVWVTEEEARSQRVGEREILLTGQQMMRLVMEAFRLRKLSKVQKGGEGA